MASNKWGAIEEVILSIDEFEAIRLADLEGLYHEQAAQIMLVGIEHVLLPIRFPSALSSIHIQRSNLSFCIP